MFFLHLIDILRFTTKNNNAKSVNALIWLKGVDSWMHSNEWLFGCC